MLLNGRIWPENNNSILTINKKKLIKMLIKYCKSISDYKVGIEKKIYYSHLNHPELLPDGSNTAAANCSNQAAI